MMLWADFPATDGRGTQRRAGGGGRSAVTPTRIHLCQVGTPSRRTPKGTMAVEVASLTSPFDGASWSWV
jgi:hypothetical protein